MIVGPDILFLSEYSVERRYGGNDEGGWWYSVRRFVRVAAMGDRISLEIDREYLEKSASNPEPQWNQSLEHLGGDDTVNSSQPEGYIPRGWSEKSEVIYITEAKVGSVDNSDQPPPRWE